MKRIHELTREELAKLTDEQVRHFIAVETAHAGHIPVQEPDVPDYDFVDIKQTVAAFRVRGIIVKTKEDALAILATPAWQSEYDYSSGGGAGYDYPWLKPEDDATIKEVMFYDRDEVLALKTSLGKNKRLKDMYEKARKEYLAYAKSISGIVDEAWGYVNDAKAFYQNVEMARKRWNELLVLTEGNVEIAANFFATAYIASEHDEIRGIILTEEAGMTHEVQAELLDNLS